VCAQIHIYTASSARFRRAPPASVVQVMQVVSPSCTSQQTLSQSIVRRSIEANRNHPRTHFGHAAALAPLGSLDEARTAAKAGISPDPFFTIRRFR
jgi:hypothetical protein